MKPTLLNGSCFDILPTLAPGSVDAIICDPPYGTIKGLGATDGKVKSVGSTTGGTDWDDVLPPDKLFPLLTNVIKPGGYLVLFGQEPFTGSQITYITNHCPDIEFLDRKVWVKKTTGNALNAKKTPLNFYEDISVFRKKGPVDPNQAWRLQRRILRYSKDLAKVSFHPTQKPLDLMRDLIRTFTNPGDVVLDYTMGSGSTGHACVVEGRRFIGIEMGDEYFAKASERIDKAVKSATIQINPKNGALF